MTPVGVLEYRNQCGAECKGRLSKRPLGVFSGAMSSQKVPVHSARSCALCSSRQRRCALPAQEVLGAVAHASVQLRFAGRSPMSSRS